jgi:RNA polymerase sigma-70 factor, ECF subfamily
MSMSMSNLDAIQPRSPGFAGVASGWTVELGEFVREHERVLYARALWLMHTRADAMDLLQDTLERALAASRRDIPRERMKGWLLTIMFNLFLDRRRTRARRACLPLTDKILDQVACATVEPAEPKWKTFDAAAVQDCLPRLPDHFRGAFELHVQGLQYTEIASALGIAPGTVGTRIMRARRQLRDLLESSQVPAAA